MFAAFLIGLNRMKRAPFDLAVLTWHRRRNGDRDRDQSVPENSWFAWTGGPAVSGPVFFRAHSPAGPRSGSTEAASLCMGSQYTAVMENLSTNKYRVPCSSSNCEGWQKGLVVAGCLGYTFQVPVRTRLTSGYNRSPLAKNGSVTCRYCLDRHGNDARIRRATRGRLTRSRLRQQFAGVLPTAVVERQDALIESPAF